MRCLRLLKSSFVCRVPVDLERVTAELRAPPFCMGRGEALPERRVMVKNLAGAWLMWLAQPPGVGRAELMGRTRLVYAPWFCRDPEQVCDGKARRD